MTRLMKNIVNGARSAFSLTPEARTMGVEKYYNPHKTDTEALCSDWLKISGDFDKALKQVTNGKKQTQVKSSRKANSTI